MKSATPTWLLGRPDGPINLRVRSRSLLVGGLLLLACLLGALLALMAGTLSLSPRKWSMPYSGRAMAQWILSSINGAYPVP